MVILLLLFSLCWSLTLDEAISIALRNTSDIRLSELELRRVEQEIKKARARILPSLGASYSYRRLDDSLVFGFSPRDRQEYSLTLTQTIFNKAVWDSISLAKKQKKLQELILEDVKREVVYRTKEMFYALVYKKLVLKLKRDNLKYWEENLRFVEEKYKKGIVPKVELLRAKAQYELARAELKEAKTDYLMSVEELKAFLRIDGELKPEGSLKLSFPANLPPPEELERKLLERNTSLRVARARLELARGSYRLAKAEYFPTLDAFLTYEGFTARSFTGGTKWIEGYVFGFSFNYKLFDGFGREANVASKKIELLKEQEKLRATLYELRKELRNALLSISSLKARIEATQASLRASEEALRLATERYREGLTTYLEVLDARNNYNKTVESLHELLYRYFVLVALVERLTR
ncbi:MAG: TolC family protein [Aquificae bacterium]|nr:TolC family protein [Aquificota bacterium]